MRIVLTVVLSILFGIAAIAIIYYGKYVPNDAVLVFFIAIPVIGVAGGIIMAAYEASGQFLDWIQRKK